MCQLMWALMYSTISTFPELADTEQRWKSGHPRLSVITLGCIVKEERVIFPTTLWGFIMTLRKYVLECCFRGELFFFTAFSLSLFTLILSLFSC